MDRKKGGGGEGESTIRKILNHLAKETMGKEGRRKRMGWEKRKKNKKIKKNATVARRGYFFVYRSRGQTVEHFSGP